MDNLKVPSDVIIAYYKRLSSRIYKCLPILEGKDLSGRIVYLPEIGQENFKKHVAKILIEIYGNASIFFCTEYSAQILGLLRSLLMEIEITNKPQIRTVVFDCMSLLEKVISQIKEG